VWSTPTGCDREDECTDLMCVSRAREGALLAGRTSAVPVAVSREICATPQRARTEEPCVRGEGFPRRQWFVRPIPGARRATRGHRRSAVHPPSGQLCCHTHMNRRWRQPAARRRPLRASSRKRRPDRQTTCRIARCCRAWDRIPGRVASSSARARFYPAVGREKIACIQRIMSRNCVIKKLRGR